MKNRWFIVNIPNPNMAQIYVLCIGVEAGQVISNDGKKAIVKLPEGDMENHGILATATEYTYEEILIERVKPEWPPSYE